MDTTSPSEHAWISVKDRMPSSERGSGAVLFYSDDLRNPTDTWCGVYRMGEWHSCGDVVVNVTHWMPLPAPPRAAINKALGGTEPKNSGHQVGE